MSHPAHKSDPELGQQVHEHLLKLGLETPMTEKVTSLTRDQKVDSIKGNFTEIMEALGLDLTDDSLQDTPHRVAKMFVDEIFWGLDYNRFPKCTTVENKMYADNSFVLEKGVTAHSTCEHHFVTIDSGAVIAYIPGDRVLGLSKLNRIAEFFAKRPQVQERLTYQICETIAFITGSPDVAVYIDGIHYCVKSRGIQDTNSSTVTLATKGVFKEDSDIRSEFLALARMQQR